jgi:hypothetical protein
MLVFFIQKKKYKKQYKKYNYNASKFIKDSLKVKQESNRLFLEPIKYLCNSGY